MIGYLKGTVAASDGQIVTLMVGGVGFEVMMPNDGETLFTIGEEAAIYTYMHVRENEIGLYGFSSALEKKLFNVLIGVSGIGPKSAMQMLGVSSPQGIITAITTGDEKLLSSLPGIGKKPLRVSSLNSAKRSPKNFRSSLRMRQPLCRRKLRNSQAPLKTISLTRSSLLAIALMRSRRCRMPPTCSKKPT